MNTTQFVVATLLKATGKVATVSAGDTKWNKVVGIGNYNIDSWQDEPDTDWDSLYDPAYSIGTVTATDTFDLDDEVRKICDTRGDSIRIYHTDGIKYTDFSTVNPTKLKQYVNGNYCAKIGRTLKFNRGFTSDDPEFGGDIQVPVYLYAAHLENANSIVPVDKPNWLVAVTAAEYVRNDTTRQNQYPNLIAEANQLMTRMKADNNNLQEDQIDRPWAAAGENWT